MSKSPSLRRIQADIRELALEPSDRYYAAPLEDDMFEWYVSFVCVLSGHGEIGELFTAIRWFALVIKIIKL
jgi:hypothetical protein